MTIFQEIKALFAAKSVVEGSLKEIKTMPSNTSVWNKFVMLLHAVGPQILNLVLMAKGMLPAQYGMWISAVLALGTYAIHVYHDIKSGGISALASDITALPGTSTATATVTTQPAA